MKRTTNDTASATDDALTAAALKGDDAAFGELHRRHAPVAWRLALAITGDPELAARAVVDATGTLSAARRAGRCAGRPHGVALAAATRNSALDLRRSGTTTSPSTSPVVADEADAVLVSAFAALPERWRSILWLRDAEGQDAARVAPVVELTTEAVDQLAVRARRGLRERYLRAQAGAAGPRSCTRAIARLGALDDGTLNAKDAGTLERHLRSCPDCSERRDRLAGLAAALPALALPMPRDLERRSHEAWTAALASPTRTGLSPRTEKALAGASALAAMLGVVGAAVFGSGGDDEPTASPLAPLVADIETPRPVDLSEVTLPLLTPAPVAGADALDRRLFSTTPRPVSTAAPGSTSSQVAGPAVPNVPAGSTVPSAPATPAVEAPASPAPQLPVAITPEDGVVVGPIQVDTAPDGGPTVIADLPGPLAALDPVVDPLLGIVNGIATPLVDGLQPVTEPLLETTQPLTDPLTDAINTVAGRLLG